MTSSNGKSNPILPQPMYTPFYNVKYIGFLPTFIKPNLWNAFKHIESLYKENDGHLVEVMKMTENDGHLVEAMKMIELDKIQLP